MGKSARRGDDSPPCDNDASLAHNKRHRGLPGQDQASKDSDSDSDCNSHKNPEQTVLRNDLLQIILTHLPWRQVLQVRRVSRKWRDAVSALQLWCRLKEEQLLPDVSLFDPFMDILAGNSCQVDIENPPPKLEHIHDESSVDDDDDASERSRGPRHHVTVSWVLGETGPRYAATEIAKHSDMVWSMDICDDDGSQDMWRSHNYLFAGLFRFRGVWVFVDSECCNTSEWTCWASTRFTLARRLDTLLAFGLTPRRRQQCLSDMECYWRVVGSDSSG